MKEGLTSWWKCKGCGCSDRQPCANGCHWSSKHLCSNCCGASPKVILTIPGRTPPFEKNVTAERRRV